jgi:hypothetical protein
MGPRDPRWASAAPAPFADDSLARPDGRCVFAAPSGHGLTCGLHAVEDATGRPRGALKPMPCRLFPLIVVDLGEDRVLLSAVSTRTARHVGLPGARSFPCLRGDTTDAVPLYESVRDTIEALWGPAAWRAVRRAARATG